MIDAIFNLIPAVMGLGVIDENLHGLLSAMQQLPSGFGLGMIMQYAKTIGLCIALGVGANECYQMMLGRRGMDIMKLLHIVIISLCISSAGTIAKIAKQPGLALEGISKSMMSNMNDEVLKQEQIVAQLQEDYINKVRESMRQLEQAQDAANAGKYGEGLEKLKHLDEILEDKLSYVGNMIQEYALVVETKICEWISLIIRLIGEILLQAILYGLLVAQRIFMHLLEAFAPLMFALSLSPHFKSAWSQWLSKFISLSLWGFVAYICMYYVFFIISYNLQQDQAAYMALMSSVSGENAQVAAIGMQAVGSTCMYIVGVLVGVKVLSMVPEAASWLIPGGVSSSAGATSAGTVTAGASMIGGAAGSVAGGAMTVGTIAAKGAQTTAGIIGDAGAAVRETNWTAAQNAAAHSNNRGGTYNKLY